MFIAKTDNVQHKQTIEKFIEGPNLYQCFMLVQARCTCGLVATEKAIFSACVRSTWKPVPNLALPSSNKLVRMGSNKLWASSHTSLPGRNPFTCNSAAHVCDGQLGLIWKLQRKYKPLFWTSSSAVATGLL